MRKSTLDPQKNEVMKEALRHIKEVDEGFIPDQEGFELMDGLKPPAVVEVILYDNDGRFALHRRNDKDFKGWAFSGSRFLSRGETIEEASRRSLRTDGFVAAVTDFRVIAVHAYRPGEHPYSMPVVMLVTCRLAPGEQLVESETERWFSDCPPDIIHNAPHAQYVEIFKGWLKFGAGGGAIIF